MSEQEELEEELADDFMSLKLLGAAKWMLVAFPFLTCLITGILILHFFNDESLLSSGEKVRRIVMGITYTIGFTQLLVHLIFVRDEVS
jgi:hypothetical protein